MTRNQRSFDSAVIRSSLIPSEKYSCSGSPLILVNGSTAIAGRSGAPARRGCARRTAAIAGSAAVDSSHGPDKAKALAGDGADQALLVAAVPQGAARRVDAAGQRRFRNGAAAPDLVEELVLGDHPFAPATPGSRSDRRPAARRQRDRRPGAARGDPGRARSLQSAAASVTPRPPRAAALMVRVERESTHTSRQNQAALKARRPALRQSWRR